MNQKSEVRSQESEGESQKYHNVHLGDFPDQNPGRMCRVFVCGSVFF